MHRAVASYQNRRRTKIIATLGPATDPPGVLDAVVAANVDVVRINCSHGSAADHRRRVEALRASASAAHRPVAVLFDIQGPKLRVADLDAPLDLVAGARVVLCGPDDTGFPEPGGAADLVVPVTFEISSVGVTSGDRVLLDDGRLELVAIGATLDPATTPAGPGAGVVCIVTRGGPLGAHKGVNLPDTDVDVPTISDKDLEDLALATDVEADWVAVSFVRSAADIDAVRALVAPGTGIVAKIERPQAVDAFDEIARAADAVMVARGDLGVETPFEQLPILQKDLIRRAIALGTPVITATEMLESMTLAYRPTRAEVTDVANAVLDGTDAVMLSGETAVGVDPAGAVATMSSVLAAAERSAHFEHVHQRQPGTLDQERSTTGALAAAAALVADRAGIGLVAAGTESGRTARLLASQRCHATIVAFAGDEAVWRRLSLYWGIVPLRLERFAVVEEQLDAACDALRDSGLARPGETVVFVTGSPNRSGHANRIQIREL